MEDKKDKKNKESESRDSFKFHFEEGVNLKSRIIHLTGTIGDDCGFEFLDAALTAMELESRRTITIKINSTGGAVYEALAMVGRISSSPCRIITEGYGAIMSAATLILACGHKRRLSQYATFMHHESSYYIGGRHSDVKEEIQQMEREEELWSKWMEKFSAMNAEGWRNKANKKNWYLTAAECEKLGVVDEVF